jgi:kynureninase
MRTGTRTVSVYILEGLLGAQPLATRRRAGSAFRSFERANSLILSLLQHGSDFSFWCSFQYLKEHVNWSKKFTF